MAQDTVALIAEAFDRHEIKYRVVETGELSFIEAGFNIQGGPTVRFHYFSQTADGNDVQIRISGLMCKVSREKRGAILEACNRINSQMRFLKFFLDKDDDLTGQGDLPARISEDCIGECCFELFLRSMQILNQCYHYFPEAYYTNSDAEKKEALLNVLKELRDNPVTIPPDDLKP